MIFDEVQLFPFARQMIKHLVEDGRYDYIETGSLISIKQNVSRILILSEEHVEMLPMDFEEFLWATDDPTTMDFIRTSFETRFLWVMPAINALWASMHNIWWSEDAPIHQCIHHKKRSRIDRKREKEHTGPLRDASKTVYGGSLKAIGIFRNIPSALSKHERTFSPSDIRSSSKAGEHVDTIYWLSESKTVNVCYRCTDPGPEMHIDRNSFKGYMVDTGSLFTAAFQSNLHDRREIYHRYCPAIWGSTKACSSRTWWHIYRFGSDEFAHSQKVDFIIPDRKGPIPIEVKSGRISTRYTSSDGYPEKYKGRKAYVIHSKDLRVEDDMVYIPIYMTMLI